MQNWTFTLHLSDKLISKTKSETNKESINRFKVSIKRSLKRATGKNSPPMWFTIESETKNGTPTGHHLHGAVVIDSVNQPQVKRALRRVAGGADAPNNAVKMDHITHPHDAQRWAIYCLKNKSPDYISRVLTQRAQSYWDALKERKKRLAADSTTTSKHWTQSPSIKPAVKPSETPTRPSTKLTTKQRAPTQSPASKPSGGTRTLRDVLEANDEWRRWNNRK